MGTGSGLEMVLQESEEQARRRGDESVDVNHVGLALTLSLPAQELLMATGVNWVDWRDQIVGVLGRNEGARATRDGRPAGSMAASLADLRATGSVAVDFTVEDVVAAAREEARANHGEVGPAHLLVALLLEGESIAAATGRWLGMTPGRMRSVAGLRNERRVVAAGAPPGGRPRSAGTGPMVLCGGGASDDLLRSVVALAPRRGGRAAPLAVLVDLGWQARRPTAEDRRRQVERLSCAGAHGVDSALTHRVDGGSPEICDLLAAADLVWFAGVDAAAIYDRLWATPALESIRDAHERGAIVGGVSAGSMVWGRAMLSDFASLGEPEPFPLFGWLGDVVVFNHYGPTREREFRLRLEAFPGCQGLAIAHGGAVVISPGGFEPNVLSEGSTGAFHALLAGPNLPLAPLKR